MTLRQLHNREQEEADIICRFRAEMGRIQAEHMRRVRLFNCLAALAWLVLAFGTGIVICMVLARYF